MINVKFEKDPLTIKNVMGKSVKLCLQNKQFAGWGRDGSERGSEANSIRSDEAQLQHQISFEDLKWRSLSIPHYESYLNVALA